MSARENQSANGRIPLSVVFITIGSIVLLTVVIIWLMAPQLMPGVLAQALSPGADSIPFPTRAALAAAPAVDTINAETEIMLSGTAVDAALINAEEAAQTDPFVGWPIRIEIPAINLDAPIDQVGLDPIAGPDGKTYYQWQVPDAYQAGWHYNSAMLGETNNVVLNGHHNVHGEVFRDLIDLKPGDRVLLYDRYQAYIYEVTEKEILAERGQPLSVRLQNATWIQSTEDERVTLITCWPYSDNTHRLVVVAKPVADTAVDSSAPPNIKDNNNPPATDSRMRQQQ